MKLLSIPISISQRGSAAEINILIWNGSEKYCECSSWTAIRFSYAGPAKFALVFVAQLSAWGSWTVLAIQLRLRTCKLSLYSLHRWRWTRAGATTWGRRIAHCRKFHATSHIRIFFFGSHTHAEKVAEMYISDKTRLTYDGALTDGTLQYQCYVEQWEGRLVGF